MIIYKITNKISGKSYIGQTTSKAPVRWGQHKRKKAGSRPLYLAFQKYGVSNFSFEVIDTATDRQELSDKERYYIEYHNTVAPNGYNLTEGGEGCSHHESTKKLLSEAKKGALNPAYGKKQSPESNKKRSEALRGRKRPQSVKDKIRASHNPKSNLNLTFRRKPNAPQQAA